MYIQDLRVTDGFLASKDHTRQVPRLDEIDGTLRILGGLLRKASILYLPSPTIDRFQGFDEIEVDRK